VKGINARAALISLFLGLPVAAQGQAKEILRLPNSQWCAGYLEQEATAAREQKS
jgi:hypothetical protein